MHTNISSCFLHQPPQSLRVWLHDRTSLTQRLQTLSQQHFSVTVLKQCWEKPRLTEAQRLNIPLHELALVREVILHGYDTPWVYARSVLPLRTLEGSLRFLRQWDNKPLGALLFRNHRIRRERPLVQQCTHSSLPAMLQKNIAPTLLWGRSSVFWHSQRNLLVSETFLPSLVDTIMSSPLSIHTP